MRVYYGKAVYGKEEIAATIDVLKNKSISLIDGPSFKELEKKINRNVKFINKIISIISFINDH